jgi:hypothetical protein
MSQEVYDTDAKSQTNSDQKRQWFLELYHVGLLACVVVCYVHHNTPTYRHTSMKYQLKEYDKFSECKK